MGDEAFDLTDPPLPGPLTVGTLASAVTNHGHEDWIAGKDADLVLGRLQTLVEDL